MRETLQQLIQLQRTDDQIAGMARRIEELDGQLDGAKAALEAAKKAVERAHHIRQEAQAATHRHEMDLQSAEQEILKLEGQLNTASSNKEFSAIRLKIGHVKAENGKIEEKILLSMDDVDEKERLEDDAKAKQREAEAALRAAEAKVDEQRQGLADELAALETARTELAAQVVPEKLRLYERIRGGNRKSGTAVVAVHGEYCQGCQMAVRPQDISDLVKGDALVLCRTCQRILVLEE